MKSLIDEQSTAQTFTTDPTVLYSPQIPDQEHHPILREEMEAAVKALKMGKSAGVDNRQGELVQAEGEAVIDILTSICNKIWKTGKWPNTWTESLVITLTKKGNLQLCKNYRTISLINHPSKVMLKVILNRLQPQAEEIRASGFQSRKEEHQRTNIQSQDPLREIHAASAESFYVFITFKMAFDRVWHAGFPLHFVIGGTFSLFFFNIFAHQCIAAYRASLHFGGTRQILCMKKKKKNLCRG